ncbi:hypothetical protein IPZ70_03160 [Streptomyces polychromogenes]|nr:hypothetical protein [Streptomyces polychromogenes]
MTRDPEAALAAESHIEGVLNTLAAAADVHDPLAQAQVHSLRTALHLLHVGRRKPQDDERRDLLRQAQVRARSTVVMIGYALEQAGRDAPARTD